MELNSEVVGEVLMIHMITEVKQTDGGIDRRASPRTAFGKRIVRVETADTESIMACVLDVSQSGARLFPPDVDVPMNFKIDLDQGLREARVVWQRGSFAGVSFSDT